MPQRDDIMVDHDEIAAHTQKLQGMVEELDGVIEGLPGIVDVMKTEAGAGTSSGAPAPVFVPVIEASSAAFGNVATSLTSIRDKIVQDIETLNAGSADMKSNDDIGSADIGNVDTNITSAGGGTGPQQGGTPPPTSGAASDPASPSGGDASSPFSGADDSAPSGSGFTSGN